VKNTRRTMTHEERLALIFAPLPFGILSLTGRRIEAKTWAGTIIGDTFYGSGGYTGEKTINDRIQYAHCKGEDGEGFSVDYAWGYPEMSRVQRRIVV
jgi:hypothetical protein